jgi:hypothetical protein
MWLDIYAVNKIILLIKRIEMIIIGYSTADYLAKQSSLREIE